MANATAARFLKQLIAAFSRFPVMESTKELYLQKLSSWRLTQAEWDIALDRIIETFRDDKGNSAENLPPLQVIYTHLKNATYRAGSEGNGAWMTWEDSDGRRFAKRIKYVNLQWVNAESERTDAYGKKIVLQKNPGMLATAPDWAVNVRIHPDALEKKYEAPAA